MDEPAWLEKARGYIDLGMFDDALNLIDSLPEDQLLSDDAHEMRIIILLDRNQYEEAFEVSRTLSESRPGNHAGFIQGAYALHALSKTQEAIDFLQTGPESLQDEPSYFYNLACYEVALGRIEAAMTWLQQSINLDPRNRSRALKDKDLEIIHSQIPGRGT
ncbi:MAG: hypothetical protein AAF357_17155 [Verrucomicrobiota bacterium]